MKKKVTAIFIFIIIVFVGYYYSLEQQKQSSTPQTEVQKINKELENR